MGRRKKNKSKRKVVKKNNLKTGYGVIDVILTTIGVFFIIYNLLGLFLIAIVTSSSFDNTDGGKGSMVAISIFSTLGYIFTYISLKSYFGG